MVALKREHGYEEREIPMARLDVFYLYKPFADRELYVTPDGLLYERGRFDWHENNGVRREWDNFLRPFTRTREMQDSGGLLPGHRIDEYAPILCWRCHTDRVQCFVSGSYETSIRCPDCGTQMVVHDG